MKVVVTGAAGMIGSNLVHGLNAIGIDDVIAVDDLTDGPKYRNLLDARISDYFDKSEFYGRFARGEFGRVDAVLHQGACSDTMEHNGRFMLDTNYRCSKDLLDDYGGYAAGEQSRDFVFIDDVVAVNLWFLQHPDKSGIFNLGSGRAQPFNDVAVAAVNAARQRRGEPALPLQQLVAQGLVEY